MDFCEHWSATARKRGSVLCAGLDPAPVDLGRGERGLPAGTDRREWSLRYLEAVAPHCAALKPNVQYWKGPGDIEVLEEVCGAARDLGLVIIEDAKLADIGSTNDAGFFYAARRADAVTFAPFAGNVAEAVSQAHARNVGIIVLCLMSNPEYAAEKRKRRAPEAEPQYLELATVARETGADGVVVGAPSGANHITAEELEAVGERIGTGTVVLMPGIGAQGGEANGVWRVFGPEQVIVNAGRALMFPHGSRSTPAEQAQAARIFNEKLNAARGEPGLDRASGASYGDVSSTGRAAKPGTDRGSTR
ncbi:MAG: orotidine 5'-phosphate decarboxylase [Spirochaetaceae bacterium]